MNRNYIDNLIFTCLSPGMDVDRDLEQLGLLQPSLEPVLLLMEWCFGGHINA